MSPVWDFTGSLEPALPGLGRSRNLMRSWKSLLNFVELSRHGEQDLAELLQAHLHLSRLASYS